MVQCIQRVPRGPRSSNQKLPNDPWYIKVIWCSKVSKRYLGVQDIQKVPSCIMYPMGTHWFKVSKGYLGVQGIKRLPSGSGLLRGGGTHRHTYKHTHK